MPNTPNIPTEPPSADDELSEAIAKLTEEAAKGTREDRPDRLSIADIIECPEAFNVRGEDPAEHHLTELKRALERMTDLDPVLILPCGDSFVLIDGHHRLEAYRRDEERTDIPVRYFEGSIEKAVLEAARINAKAVLPLNNQQRQNLAWRLDLTGRYTKPQVMEAAGISDGQIAIMRRAKRKLGSQASEFDAWWKAKRAADGNPNSWTEQEDIDAWRQHRAQVIADKLAKTFGPKLSGNPTIAALALEIHFGRKLADLTQELIDICQDELEEDDEDTDF
ncbi:ParB-like nuclease domain-containing protein [Cohaesibacter marisflavi]|uniref:ParB-like nuclease domain-containing protein n=1 Tax=Cohaesibacter marisflavi TaxID=655353 RepID=A0A1I5JII3_9HYPH|nr:ParB N-terminal domain-containing protein [Cohaesibacter marisflavi]SFO72624.1 ParB-like nuclease domain-containing protein [Cohaesibacter marisflavi]